MAFTANVAPATSSSAPAQAPRWLRSVTGRASGIEAVPPLIRCAAGLSAPVLAEAIWRPMPPPLHTFRFTHVALAAAGVATVSFRRGGRGRDARIARRAKKKMEVKLGKKGPRTFEDIMNVTPPAEGESTEHDPGVSQLLRVRKTQLDSLNNFVLQKHKRDGRRGKVQQVRLGDAASVANHWRDRYLLCQDCQRRDKYRDQPPRKNCNMSTLLEVDMTAPFSRDNVMATSCEIVQMIKEDVWCRRDAAGTSYVRVQKEDKGTPGTFPVQVCAVCWKTSLQELRKLKTCSVCQGVHYCSNQCFAAHRLKHRASCVLPWLPYRTEWGVRPELKQMQKEIYPCIGMFAIRPVEKHMFAWRREEPKVLPQDTTRPGLPFASDGSLAVIGKEIRKLTTRVPKTRVVATSGRGPITEPDDVALLSLGMSREEFKFRSTQILGEVELDAKKEEEEEAALALASANAASMETVVQNFTLDVEAIERVEAAAKAAPKRRRMKPPWEMVDETPPWVGPVTTPPEGEIIEEKEGVIYKPSLAEQIAKKRGLRLSKAALERLEAAAALGKASEKDKRYVPAIIDKEKKDRLLL